MDVIERAQAIEEADRQLLQRQHLTRTRPKATAVLNDSGGIDYYCATCDEQLEPHRVEFGTCFDCALEAEIRARQFARRPA